MVKDAEFSGEEKEMIALLEKVGLPDDFSEVALQDISGPDHDMTDRIRSNVFRKINRCKGANNRGIKSLWSKASVRLATAAVLVLLFIVAIIGPGRVIAEFKEAFRWVPGFGLQPEQKLSLALPENITVDLDYMTLVVEGLKADRESTVLKLKIYDLSEEFLHEYCPVTGGRLENDRLYYRDSYEHLPQLVDEDGNRYEFFERAVGREVSFSNSEQSYVWSSEVYFDPLPSQTSKVTLLLPDLRQEGKTLKVEIPLVPKEDIQEAIPHWPSTTLNDITVAASAEVGDEETIINLAIITEEKNWEVSDMIYRRPYTVDTPYMLKDDRGKMYSYHLAESSISGYSNEEGLNVYHLSFDPASPEAEYLKFNIVSIWITVDEKVSYPLQLSRLEKDNPVPLDEDIQLGHHSFQITELSPYKNGVKAELDLGPVGQETLIDLRGFYLEPAEGRGFDVHGRSTRGDDGRLKTIYSYFSDHDVDEAILHVGYPLVEIEGPWELKIPLDVE